jgi:Holliday junction resolvase RusA-like endonuclease
MSELPFEKPRSMRIFFIVQDTPRPGGSKTAFINNKTGRAMIVDSCKESKTWRTSVREAAMDAIRKVNWIKPEEEPIKLNINFFLERPAIHYKANLRTRPMKDSAPFFHTKKPDLLKLTRSTEDALTGLIWRDDSQIAQELLDKRYSNDGFFGAKISIEIINEKSVDKLVNDKL